MLIRPPESPWPKYAKLLENASHYALGITAACYVTGFVITNMYLGSLGVVNLDLLKARYILAGMLFMIFLASICYLLYEFIKTFRTYRNTNQFLLVLHVIYSSLKNIILPLIIILLLAIISGLSGTLPTGIPHLSPIRPSLSVWLGRIQPASIVVLFFTLVCACTAFFLAVVVIICMNPKDASGVRRPRISMPGRLWAWIKADWRKGIGKLFALCLVMIVLFLGTDLLTFISSNGVGYSLTFPFVWGRFPAYGWLTYIGAIVIIYVTIVSSFYFSFLLRLPASHSRKGVQAANKSYLIAIASLLLLMIVLPVYTLGIYPSLPQQVGGGKVLKVQVAASDDDLKPVFDDPNAEVYLVDRSASTVLFLVADMDSQETQIIEVKSDSISSITYSP